MRSPQTLASLEPRAGIDAADVAHAVSSHGLCGTNFRFAGRLWQELLTPTACRFAIESPSYSFPPWGRGA